MPYFLLPVTYHIISCPRLEIFVVPERKFDKSFIVRFLTELLWFYGQAWWRHQMETFSALLAICAGSSPVSGEFPAQRPVTRSFDVFFDLHPNKRLSKQWWGWLFETASCPLWRHRNERLQNGGHGDLSHCRSIVYGLGPIIQWHVSCCLKSRLTLAHV